MTHDELLTKIKHYEIQPWSDMPHDKDELASALRAVVELHKPWDVETGGGTFTLCNDCSRRVDLPEYGILYPCKTIQAIEKEFK